MTAVPCSPPVVAVTVDVPAATPFTRPDADTVATDALDVAHVIVRPASALPLPSFAVADSCTVLPITRVLDEGVTDTEATAGGVSVTVTPVVSLTPSLVATT